MVQITYTLRLDMRDTGIVNTSLRLKQGDSGMKIAVNVFNGGVSAFDSSTTPKIVFRRPDGASVMADMTVESSLYSYTLVGNELQVPGKELIDIKFPIGAEGRESTMSCSIEVVPDTITPNTHGSGIYDNDLAELVEEATEAAETVQEVVGDSEAWADGTRGGVPVGPDDPAYHNNSKYWSEQANPTALANLTDVDVDGVVNGDLLQYNSTTHKWEASNTVIEQVENNASDIDDIDAEISAICNVYGSKNLCPIESRTISGFTFAPDKNGYMTCSSNEDTRAWGYTVANQFITLKAGTYFIKAFAKTAGTTGYYGIRLFDSANNAIFVGDWNEVLSNGQTFTLSADTDIGIVYKVGNGSYAFLIMDNRIKDRTYVPYAPTNHDLAYVRDGWQKNGAYNLCQITNTTQTIDGVTWTVYDDGRVIANCSSNNHPKSIFWIWANSTVRLSFPYTVRVCGAPIGAATNTYHMGGAGVGGELYTEINVPANTNIGLALVVAENAVVNNIVFKPLITTDLNAKYDDHEAYTLTNRELTEVVKTNPTITNTTSNASVVSHNIYKCGKVVQFILSIKTTTAIAAGGNINFSSSGMPVPKNIAALMGYAGTNIIMGYIGDNGDIIGRAITAIPADYNFNLVATYLTK